MSEYIVVLANNRQELVEQVNARLKDGYVLVGGVCLDNDGSRGVFAQAMAK